MNNACQLKNCSNKPDTTGPIAGPNVITEIHNAIAEPRFSGEVTTKAVFIKIGISIPVPDA